MLSCVCGSEYTLVQPDQLEHPGDEFVSLFPTFVVNNSSTESIESIKQSRYNQATIQIWNNYGAIQSFIFPISR